MVYNCAKFQNHRAFRKRFTEGGRNPPPPAVLGFKKPGLFRVNVATEGRILCFCIFWSRIHVKTNEFGDLVSLVGGLVW